MHLTQVAPTGSMVAKWKITRERCRSSKPGSLPRKGVARHLFQLRWPEGFRCPRCGRGKAWAVGATLFQCSGCDHQTSVTAGTVFQDTRKPLTIWFRAMWFVTSQKNGASALGLQRAWDWAVIGPLGRGYINCGARWSDPVAIGSRAGWK